MNFATRLNLLMEEKNVTQKEMAECLGISRQAVAQYLAGNTKPNTDVLTKIVNFFSVSADYLLGVSPIRTQDITTQEMCAQLGLSEWSIDILQRAAKNKNDNLPCFLNEIIDYLLDDYELFDEYRILREMREKGIEYREGDISGSAFEQDERGHWLVSMYGGFAARFLAQEIGGKISNCLLNSLLWSKRLKELRMWNEDGTTKEE